MYADAVWAGYGPVQSVLLVDVGPPHAAIAKVVTRQSLSCVRIAFDLVPLGVPASGSARQWRAPDRIGAAAWMLRSDHRLLPIESGKIALGTMPVTTWTRSTASLIVKSTAVLATEKASAGRSP